MTDTFGAHLSGLSPEEAVVAEVKAGKHERFAALDAFLADLLRRSFVSGERVVDITYARRSTGYDTVSITNVESAQRELLDDQFTLERQEARGAWFLPQEASLKVGICNLAGHMAAHPRFAINATRDESVKVDLRASADTLAAWALLVPVFADLLAPIELRAPTGQLKPADQQRKVWAAVDETYAALDIEADAVLAVMRPGGGWASLRAADQVAARQALLGALARQVGEGTASRWRIRAIGGLAAAYYRKAKQGPPLAKAVLTKAHQQTLAAVFGGDWLALLEYLEEQPNPAERITTALPEPRLYIRATAKTASVAAQADLPVDEVERMLAAYLGATGDATSPVEKRVEVMRRWWDAFDALHAAQRPGQQPLWGLVDEGIVALDNDAAPEPYLYRQLLDADLVDEIDRLWDGVTLPRWPERIVSEFHPHRQMADAFGPASAFWHGVALTCWYVCEGPYSRTDIAGLEKYHQRQLTALDEAGYPIDRALFKELKRAEKRLGPPQQLWAQQERHEVTAGVTLTIGMGGGTRREGFEILRDVVTQHRRNWAQRHLDEYLHHRWDSELREVAREHSRRVAARGKPPTLKQFASFAATAANHWFGGDLGAVYAAVGEPAPARLNASTSSPATRWTLSARCSSPSVARKPSRDGSGSCVASLPTASATSNSTRPLNGHPHPRNSDPTAFTGTPSAVPNAAGPGTRLRSMRVVRHLAGDDRARRGHRWRREHA